MDIMTTEAQRLADAIDPDLQVSPHSVVLIVDLQAAAAELRRLDDELTLCAQLKREYQEQAAQAMAECEQMTEVHHIEHTLVALVRPHNAARDVNITIGMVGCMGMVAITTRAGVEALRDACEAALKVSAEKL
jgi:S-ribosylhomocysteine lyase LuxS involved in autoinducer biosynthesis